MNNSSDYIYWSELHCSKDALTDRYGWFMQFLLAVLAFTCLIGKSYVLNYDRSKVNQIVIKID